MQQADGTFVYVGMVASDPDAMMLQNKVKAGAFLFVVMVLLLWEAGRRLRRGSGR